jgi:hypothetical protein
MQDFHRFHARLKLSRLVQQRGIKPGIDAVRPQIAMTLIPIQAISWIEAHISASEQTARRAANPTSCERQSHQKWPQREN